MTNEEILMAHELDRLNGRVNRTVDLVLFDLRTALRALENGKVAPALERVSYSIDMLELLKNRK